MTPHPSRRRKIIRSLAVVLVVVIGLALLVWFTRGAWLPLPGRWLVVSDPLEPAAAVVALAGGTDRIIYAAELFNQGYAGRYNTRFRQGWISIYLTDFPSSAMLSDVISTALATTSAHTCGPPEVR